mgnify:CR=1 FL=1
MSNIKACIFDLDGTLTNTINAIAHFGNIALAAFGLPEIPVEDYKIYVGDGRDKLIHRMLGVYARIMRKCLKKCVMCMTKIMKMIIFMIRMRMTE